MPHSMNQRGFAAAQCGKAPPFRRLPFSFEAAPHESERAPDILHLLVYA